jgi:hypothetical protein
MRSRTRCGQTTLTPHAFRVVVLTYRARVPHVVLDFPELAHADPVEVHDGAARLNELPLELGTDRQPLAQKLFILDLAIPIGVRVGELATHTHVNTYRKVLEHALLRGDFVELLDVDFAELLDVDGPAVL